MSLSLAEAAPVLGTSPESLRRWIRKGCPATLGGPGRGKGSHVDVDQVLEWRAATTTQNRDAQIRELASIALDFHRRGREPGELGQRVLGIDDAKTAALLVFFLNYCCTRWKIEEPRTNETELLTAIALQNGYAVTDSIPCVNSTTTISHA